MKKISIIGAAGTLGASCAMTISLECDFDELCLIDVNEALLDNHIMDFENAFPNKNIYRGAYEDLEGTSIVVITAGVPNRNDETSRDAYLKDNITIFEQIGGAIYKYAPDSIILTASNPVDLLNYYLYQRFGFNRHQLIGYTLNDSLRFSWAINKVLSQKKEVYSPVLGEHGETQVPIFSHIKIENQEVKLLDIQKQQIQEEIKTWFVRFNNLNVPRTTGWTTSVGVSQLIRALSKKEEYSTVGSVILTGEYGYEGVSVGVPIVINNQGVQKVNEWELTLEEQDNFDQSVQKITKSIEDNPFIFKRLIKEK